jgi:rhodanese-related sulfurtransferase
VEFIQQNWYWAALAAVSGSLLVVNALKGGRGLSPAQATACSSTVKMRSSSTFARQANIASGHLLNARHIPLGELDKRIGELDKLKNKPVILSCQSGSRSASGPQYPAARPALRSVHNLEGGIAAWEQAGMPSQPEEEIIMQPKILMYATAVCPYCVRAEGLLRRKGVTEIEKVRIDTDPARRDEMMERTGRPPHRSADLHRRLPRRWLRRPLRP